MREEAYEERPVYGNKEYCLRPGCHRYRAVRGLCRPCYKAAERLAREGKITWAKLEKKGLALPPKDVGRPASDARTFFLEEGK